MLGNGHIMWWEYLGRALRTFFCFVLLVFGYVPSDACRRTITVNLNVLVMKNHKPELHLSQNVYFACINCR